MASKSPIRSAQPASVSVCGKLLKNGQSIVVPESAVGPREKTLQARGQITVRSSNEKGKVQILCTLG